MRTWLTRLSLGAGVAFTASAEYQLARTLGADQAIAAMLPVAVDAYVIAALRWFRAFDIALSLSLMGATQISAHLLDARVMRVNIPMVVVISLLVPVAIWRTHALARRTAPEVAPGEEFASPAEVPTAPFDAPAEPVEPEPVPVLGPFIAMPQLPAAAHATPAAADVAPDALMSVADVAKTKGVAEGTVRSWVARNKLTPAQRDSNGRLLFHPATVAALD